MRLIDADKLQVKLIGVTELGWEIWGVEEEDIKNAPSVEPSPDILKILEEAIQK